MLVECRGEAFDGLKPLEQGKFIRQTRAPDFEEVCQKLAYTRSFLGPVDWLSVMFLKIGVGLTKVGAAVKATVGAKGAGM